MASGNNAKTVSLPERQKMARWAQRFGVRLDPASAPQGDDGAQGQNQPQPAQPQPPDAGVVKARLATLVEKLKLLNQANAGMATPLIPLAQSVKTALVNGRLAEALRVANETIDKVELSLAQAQGKEAPAAPLDPRDEQIERRLQRLAPDLEAALRRNDDSAKAIDTTLEALQLCRSTRDYDSGLKEVGKLEINVRRALRAENARKALAAKEQEQRLIHKEMATAVQVTKQVALPKGWVGQIEARKKELSIGKNFRKVLEAMKKCETEKSGSNLQALEEECNKYLAIYQGLKPEERGQPAMNTKADIARQALKQARIARLAAEYEALGEPPWSPTKEARAAEVQAAFFFEEGAVQSKDGKFGAAPLKGEGAGGVNAAWWIKRKEPTYKGDKAERQYIFKPADAEDSIAYGLPAGSGAPREALAKALSDQLMADAGLDVGVCPTTLASISSQMLPNEQGRTSDKPTRMGAMQKLAVNQGGLTDKLKEDATLLNRIDKKNFDQIAAFDLITGNLDRHGGNILVDDDKAHGKARMVPIDHGTSMPGRETLKLNRHRVLAPQNVLMTKDIAQKDQLMDEEVRRGLMLVDPEAAVQKVLMAQEGLARSHPEAAGAFTEEHARVMKRSIEFVQKAADKLAVGDMFTAMAVYTDRIHDATPEDLDRVVEEIRADLVRRKQDMAAVESWVDMEAPREKFMPNAAKFQALGWCLGYSPGDVQGWVHDNPGRAAKILKGKIENPQARAQIRAMVDALGGPDKAPRLDGLTLAEQFNLLKPLVDRNDEPPGRVSEDDLRREVERLGGAKALAAVKAFCKSENPSDPFEQVTTLKRWERFGREPGVQEYIRLGGQPPRNLADALSSLAQLRADAEAFRQVDALSDADVAAKQKIAYRAAGTTIRDRIAEFKSGAKREDFNAQWLAALQKIKDGQVDQGHAGLDKLLPRVSAAVEAEKKEIAQAEEAIEKINGRLGAVRQSDLSRFPTPPQEVIVGVKKSLLVGDVDRALKDLKVLEINLSRILDGDNSEYAKYEKTLNEALAKVDSYRDQPFHAGLMAKYEEARQRFLVYEFGLCGASINSLEGALRTAERVAAANRDIATLRDVPNLAEIQRMASDVNDLLARFQVKECGERCHALDRQVRIALRPQKLPGLLKAAGVELQKRSGHPKYGEMQRYFEAALSAEARSDWAACETNFDELNSRLKKADGYLACQTRLAALKSRLDHLTNHSDFNNWRNVYREVERLLESFDVEGCVGRAGYLDGLLNKVSPDK